MFEKLRHKSGLLIPTALLFGFIFYVGQRLQTGETMKGNRGIMRWLAEGLNALADTFGPAIAGYGIMALAVFGGTFVAVWIWRDPMM